MRPTDRIYRELTPRERLRAFVAALARNDIAEADKLVDTCAEKTYRMKDVDFSHRFRTLMNIAADHERVMYQYALGVAVGSMMGGMSDEGSPRPDEAERLTWICAKALVTWLSAWDKFCSELDIPQAHIEAAFLKHGDGPLGMVLRAARVMLDHGVLTADPNHDLDIVKAEAEYLQDLRERWRLRD